MGYLYHKLPIDIVSFSGLSQSWQKIRCFCTWHSSSCLLLRKSHVLNWLQFEKACGSPSSKCFPLKFPPSTCFFSPWSSLPTSVLHFSQLPNTLVFLPGRQLYLLLITNLPNLPTLIRRCLNALPHARWTLHRLQCSSIATLTIHHDKIK